jgi:glycosyltransferase involved in cell wall biosynthesis
MRQLLIFTIIFDNIQSLPVLKRNFNRLFWHRSCITSAAHFAFKDEKSIEKILFITRGGSVSGSQRQLLYLVENLDRRIYEPVVVCNKGGELAEKLKRLNVEVVVRRLYPWRKFLTMPLRIIEVRRLLKFARQKNVSLIHCCDLWLGGYMQYIAKRLNVPSVLHVRMPVTPRDVYKFKCDAADRVVAISRKITDNLLTAGIDAEKIVRIDDSVDVERFSPEKTTGNILRSRFSLDGELLIGIIGRIDAFKRQLDFLAAAKEILSRSNYHVKFFLIGEVHCPVSFSKIQKYILENNMQDRVLCTGRLNDMPEVISSLDILVSLSGGSVMFEAMASGKAVISAGFTPRKFSYHIQDGCTGLLIESQEPAALAGAITKLIDNPQLRQQLGRRARQWAVKELTHEIMVRKTQQLYASLLNPE